MRMTLQKINSKQNFIEIAEVRKDFSILKDKIKGKTLTYLDSSATSLTPDVVVDKVNQYYKRYNANIHRGIHDLSQIASKEYELAHQKVADFINADFEEVIFTRGTTESLNLLAYSLTKKLKKGDEIVLTEMEHHSNLVPWQQIAKEKNLILKYIKITPEGDLDLDNFKELITENTKIVSVIHASNVLGTINDIKQIAKITHEQNA